MFLFTGSDFLDLLRGFHEEWEDGPQAEDVDKLVTVVRALGSNHGMVQYLQGTAARDLLLSVKTKYPCSGADGCGERWSKALVILL